MFSKLMNKSDTPSATKPRKNALIRQQTEDCPGTPRGSNARVKAKTIIRVCVLGSSKVGKTSIVRRLVGKSYHEQYVPTVYETYMKHASIDEKEILLDIQDMAGAMYFPVMEKYSIENTDVILLVFSLDDFRSCDHAVKLSMELEEIHGGKPVLIIGNKSDLYEGGSDENRAKIEEFINKCVQRKYIEMSAKFDRFAHNLLKEIFEAHEIAQGPYRVTRASTSKGKGLFNRLLERSSNYTKSCNDLR